MDNLDYINNVKYLYEKNLLFFEYYYPQLYKKFKNFDSNKYKIVFDKVGNINILDIENNTLLYSDDPLYISKEQVKNFINKPLKINFSAIKYSNLNQNLIFNKYLSKIYNLSPLMSQESLTSKLNPNNVLLIWGVGLGYHIKFLCEYFNIKYLFILEEDEELFYPSLGVIDWEEIFEYIKQNKGFIIIDIFKDKNTLEYVFFKTNPVLLNKALLYIHFKKDYPNLEYFIEKLKFSTYAYGFYDDEKLSLKNTIINIKNKIPLLNSLEFNETLDTVPAFIIGSGPSLDNSINIIRKYKDKAIIFSCGTALQTLEKEQIVPDFHIEIERTIDTFQKLEHINKNYIKEITIIGNNTVPIEAFNLFDKKFMFLKSIDTGSNLFSLNIPRLIYSNPTVVNGALSLVLELGFKNIYFFGIDLGAKKTNYHHSKHSLSMDSNSKFFIKDMDLYLEKEGNLGDRIFTNDMFLFTLSSIENLIKEYINKYKKIKKDILIFNCSDGLKIQNTIPLNPNSLELYKNINKHEVIKYIESRFSDNYINDIKLIEVLKQFYNQLNASIDYILHILNNVNIDNRTQIIEIFFYMFKRVSKEPVLMGTILHFQHLISSHIYYIQEENEAIDYINKSFAVMKEFLLMVKEDIKEVIN